MLDQVNLQIRAGECVAITGVSGCGKTTLVKLILGLLEPTEGEIRIGGRPLTGALLAQYRANVGTVMQDDMLFTGSVADNITFFDPEPNHERMRDCARMASVHEEVERMPLS